MEKVVLNADIGEVLSFSQNVWSVALTKLSGPRAFWHVVMVAFFAAIIIATRQVIGASSLGDVILILLVGLRQIRFGEIIAAFDLVGETMRHGTLIASGVE